VPPAVPARVIEVEDHVLRAPRRRPPKLDAGVAMYEPLRDYVTGWMRITLPSGGAASTACTEAKKVADHRARRLTGFVCAKKRRALRKRRRLRDISIV